MKIPGFLIVASTLSLGSNDPAAAQVNMQYSGQANGQYNGQYGGQYSGQFSGQYYGRGSSDQNGSPNARDQRHNIFGPPVNSGECGQLTRPIRESAVFWSDWCVRTRGLTRRTGLPSAFHRLTTGTLQRA